MTTLFTYTVKTGEGGGGLFERLILGKSGDNWRFFGDFCAPNWTYNCGVQRCLTSGVIVCCVWLEDITALPDDLNRF